MTVYEQIKDFQDMIDNSKYIVFFGGAGVSTASGIPDFRSPKGLYNRENNYKYEPEIMLSHSFFVEHTKEFFDFYRNEMCALGYEPCITHKKLAELEKNGRLKAVITQNIDGLHQIAGSKKVIELHGTIHSNKCMICGKEFNAEYMKKTEGVPICDKCKDDSAIIKPCVTLYEEELPYGAFESAVEEVEKADLLIIAGTSLTVYPAASLVDYFDKQNGKIVLVNKGKVDKHITESVVDLAIDCDMNEVFDKISA